MITMEVMKILEKQVPGRFESNGTWGYSVVVLDKTTGKRYFISLKSLKEDLKNNMSIDAILKKTFNY